MAEKESVMNKEDVNWLLQTIKDPGDAKRFLLAQYQRGRISLDLMNDVTPAAATERWTEHSAMALVLAFAW
jgi:hypothetical protein